MYTNIDTVSQALDYMTIRGFKMWSLWFWNAGISKALQSASRNQLHACRFGRINAEEQGVARADAEGQRLAKNSRRAAHQAIDNLAFFA